jgi:recombinational DNA repair protein RecT
VICPKYQVELRKLKSLSIKKHRILDRSKQLLKILPRSVELQKAMAMDETVKTKLDIDMVSVPDETDYQEDKALEMQS